MRRLLLLRHAKAERQRPGQDDRERVLKERGRADASRLGAYILRHGFVPDRALVSPSARTRETWSCATNADESFPAAIEAGSLYDANETTLLDIVQETPDSIETLMVVGHNPGLHDLAVFLVASGDLDVRQQLNEQFPTTALAVIEFPFESWTMLHAQSGRLERFVTPKILLAATD